MAKASRDKGKRGEREFSKALEGRGISHDRLLDGRHQVHGDVLAGELAIEVRRRERIEIVKWCRDHEAEVPAHLIPVVAFRPNEEPWRVTLTLDDFLDLLEAARV